MKTLIASFVSLLLGLALGWYIEHRHAEHEKADIVKQMLDGNESFYGEHAARAVRVIELIESGQNQEAVQRLSGPIADYYDFYVIHAGTDTDRERKLRAMIEELASTNQIVADAITNEIHSKIQ
jgi:hypothetical protein